MKSWAQQASQRVPSLGVPEATGTTNNPSDTVLDPRPSCLEEVSFSEPFSSPNLCLPTSDLDMISSSRRPGQKGTVGEKIQ